MGAKPEQHIEDAIPIRRVFERVMKPVVVRFPEPIDQFEGFPL